MNFLEVNDNEQTEEQSAVIKKRFQPLLYLVALIVVVSLSFLWFSLQANLQAFDYLPTNTRLFWQWSDQETLDNTDFFLPSIDVQQASAKSATMKSFLGDNTGLLDELIWFQKENDSQDYFLVKTKRELSKEELNNFSQLAQPLYVSLLTKQIILLSPQEEKKDAWPVTVKENFLAVDSSQGLNIYLSAAVVDQFIKNPENFTLPWLNQEDLFIHLTDQRLKIYQTGEQADNFDWHSVLLPEKGQAIMAISDWSATNWQDYQKNIWPVVFSSLPASALEQKELVWPATLLWQNAQGQYLAVSKTDLRSVTPLFFSELALVPQERTLADGTLYQELVLDDLVWQDLSWPEARAWQREGLFILQQGDFYYLSNSEDILRSLQPERSVASVADCLDMQDRLVDWLFLDQKTIQTLKLDTILPKKAEFLDFNVYSGSETHGWQICW